MNSRDIEIVVAEFFDYRANLVVPRVSWGLEIHECDLLVLSRANYATEIEIKVSATDLKRDGLKPHGHRSQKIRHLYFAMPSRMETYAELIDERAGIILVDEDGHGLRCRKFRNAQANAVARKFTDAERYQLARLGAMRIWGLKRDLSFRSNRSEADYQI